VKPRYTKYDEGKFLGRHGEFDVYSKIIDKKSVIVARWDSAPWEYDYLPVEEVKERAIERIKCKEGYSEGTSVTAMIWGYNELHGRISI